MSVVASLIDLIAPDQVGKRFEDKALADEVRGKQTADILNATPKMLVASAINIALAIGVLWSNHGSVMLYAWAALAGVLLLSALWSVRRIVFTPAVARPTKSVRKTVFKSLMLGLLWGTLPALFFVQASPLEKVFITCVVGGMMGGGALALSRLPAAANAMILPIAGGALIAFLGVGGPIFWVCSIMLVNFTIALMVSTRSIGRSFADVCVAERKNREDAETIGLLLREFEDNSGDWIWQMDAKGRFVDPAKRFCETSGRSAEQLEAATLFDLIVAVPEMERRRSNVIDVANLRELFAGRHDFREITVAVSTPYGRKWWVISGHAIFDKNEEFQGYKGVCSDISDRKEAELKLSLMARQDPLTGLANRTEFTRLLTEKLKSTAADSRYTAVLYLDLDRFKNVNDTLGHLVGDKLLVEVSKRLQSLLKPGDTASRFGGDEFAIFASNEHGVMEAERLCDDIIMALAEPVLIEGHHLMIGTSIGYTVTDGTGKTPEALIHAADLALYRAKAEGRGTHKLYAEHMDSALKERRALEGELRQAVANRELDLHYQPLVDIKTGDVLGFEALLRWNNPRRGMIAPDRFIPLAEETGLIHDIGDWVLMQACQQAKEWPSHMKVSVNLSARQLTSFRIVQRVVEALRKSNLPPQRLELEVTESTLIADPDKTLELLRALRELGVSIALDDFGTGYSSLSYLVRFPFDKLKIDKTFVHEAERSAESLAIVRSILSLAANLNIVTLAEGIETREHVELLRAEGCQQAQGFLLSKPLPRSELREFSRYPIAEAETATPETAAKILQINERLNAIRRGAARRD